MASNEITNCTEALRVLAAYLDGELDGQLRIEVARHIDTCRSCYSRAEFERQLKASVAALASEPVPPRVAERVQVLLREFSTSAGQ